MLSGVNDSRVDWKRLAAEVRSIPEADLKRVWRSRFLAPLQAIEKGMPNLTGLLLGMAERNDWATLRDFLEIAMNSMGEIKEKASG